MARYTVQLRSPKAVDDCFEYLADLRNFADWDPGVVSVDQVAGSGAGSDGVFDVVVKGVGRPMTLRYHTVSFDPPTSVVVRAESSRLTSLDTITVTAESAGSLVTYDAVLELNGVLGIADPLLGLAFRRIGERAATGLLRVLEGERVEGRSP